MGLTTRDATFNDATDIARIHVRTWQSAYRGLLPDDALDAMTPDQRRPMWEGLLAAPPGAYGMLVVERDGTLVGFSSFGRPRDPEAPNDTFELFAIYVDPDVQGQGAGTRLLTAAETAMRDAGATKAVLWVLAGNHQAERFYRKHGWIPAGTEKSETLFGTELQELLYTRDLNTPRSPNPQASPA